MCFLAFHDQLTYKFNEIDAINVSLTRLIHTASGKEHLAASLPCITMERD